MEVLAYERVAYEENEVGDAAGGMGNVGNLAMVHLAMEVDRIDESSMGTYVIDLVVDKEI